MAGRGSGRPIMLEAAVDWLLQPATPQTASSLRSEISRLLRRHAEDRDQVWRAELVVAELVGNAVEHAGGPIWVSLDWTASHPVLAVHDLGPSFHFDPSPPDVAAERGRGLWLASQIAKDLSVAAKRRGGKRIQATLPLNRRAERSLDPPRRQVDPMPNLAEARPNGFGLQPFLRALVVELARAVEKIHGPAAAEQVVAQVGATAGGQMEREYRQSQQIAGRLTPAQITDCYVRLKSAIDGEFYAIEIEDDRIVLGNNRCPFGHAVLQSPALCRVTSSVFGGIAARNSGHAVVFLDERIAVGDPECRVTVLLGKAALAAVAGHHYSADTETWPVDTTT